MDHARLERRDEQLVCDAAHHFPVVRDVPRFVSSENYAASFGYQWNRFRTTQLDVGQGESLVTFVEKTGLGPEDVRNRTVLDGGCGMGRFLAVVADWGGVATGVDLTAAVDAASANLGARARVVQADLFRLPFAAGSYEVVFSIGVLHHTPDTRAAFESLARMVTPGGRLCVWVYSGERRDRLAAGLKYAYRRATRRMDPVRLERLARIAVPMYRVHRTPGLGFLTRKLVPTSMHPNPEWRVLDTLDDYAPFYRWRHTYDEVEGWFRALGYVDVERMAVPVAVRGRAPNGAK